MSDLPIFKTTLMEENERLKARVAELEKENAELKVHVEYLIDVVDEVSTATNSNMLPQEVRDLACNAIASVPEQSLAQHDKEAKAKMLVKIAEEIKNEQRINSKSKPFAVAIILNTIQDLEQLQEQE